MTFDVGGVLLSEHGCQYWVSIKCFPDHTVTFRFKNVEATAPSGMDICIGENGFGRMRVDSELQQLNQAEIWSGSAPLQVFNRDERVNIVPLSSLEQVAP